MPFRMEVRGPLLDYELVEFAATIPSWLKRDAIGGKIILKKAVKDLLPNEILNKPKAGFGFPVAKWFRKDLTPMLRETLLDEKSARRGLLKKQLLTKMINEHVDGYRDWSKRLWAFLFLEFGFGSLEFID
jgi:asparagine synthase (glutamine-hydrolysing)